MTLQLAWVDGGTAEVLQTDGERAVVNSSRAAAPGQPVTGQVRMVSTQELRLKVQSCKRQENGKYQISGRWLDLTRAMRDEIVHLSRAQRADGA